MLFEEVEKRVDEKLKEKHKETREARHDEKETEAFKDATEGLEVLARLGVGKLKVPHLKGILLVFKVKAEGKCKEDPMEQPRKHWEDASE